MAIVSNEDWAAYQDKRRQRFRRRHGLDEEQRAAERIDRERAAEERAGAAEAAREAAARAERHDRIDDETRRRREALFRPMGPQAGAEAIATPGYRVGLNVVLDCSRGADLSQAWLHEGIVAVRGQLVRLREKTRLGSDVEWVNDRLTGAVHYVYLAVDGGVYMDRAVPQFDGENFYAAHPIYADRVALGHVWIGLQDRILLAVTGVDRRVEVTVASAGYRGAADYYCDGVDDEVEINAAALYLIQRNGGGVVRLLSGSYSAGEQVLLRGPRIQLEGVGRATTVWRRAATEDAGTTSAVVVNLRSYANDADAVDADGEDGTADTQVRDVMVAYGEGESLKAVFHTGWGGTVEPGEAISELRSELRARFPELVVGALGEDQSVTGAEQLYADGDQLILRRSNGTEWVVNVKLEAGRGEGADPAITLTSLDGRRVTTLRANSLRVGGSIRGTSLSVGGSVRAVSGVEGRTVRGQDSVTSGGNVSATGAVTGASLTVSGEVDGATLDISGDADIDGTLALGSIANIERTVNNITNKVNEIIHWLGQIPGHTHRVNILSIISNTGAADRTREADPREVPGSALTAVPSSLPVPNPGSPG